MSALLLVTAALTSSSSSLMSCLPLVSLMRVMTLNVLPVSLLPLPAAAEAATEVTRQRYTSHYPSPLSPHFEFTSSTSLIPLPSIPPLPHGLLPSPHSPVSPRSPQRGNVDLLTPSNNRNSNSSKGEATNNISPFPLGSLPTPHSPTSPRNPQRGSIDLIAPSNTGKGANGERETIVNTSIPLPGLLTSPHSLTSRRNPQRGYRDLTATLSERKSNSNKGETNDNIPPSSLRFIPSPQSPASPRNPQRGDTDLIEALNTRKSDSSKGETTDDTYPSPHDLLINPHSRISPRSLQRGNIDLIRASDTKKGLSNKGEMDDNATISWGAEYTLEEDSNENSSSSYSSNSNFSSLYSSASSSLPPCVAEELTVNNSDVNDTCYPNEIDRTSRVGSLEGREWVRIVGFSLIFVVGVVGNVLVVVTLLHHRNLRSLTNVFLLNLAVSDLLLGVFCMPFTLVGSLLQDFVFGALMCRLIPYMQAVSVSVSVWTLVAISLERFYAICQPLRSRRWQTPSHAYKVIAGVWAASLLLMTPIAALSTLMPVRGDAGRHKCREVWVSLEAERTFTILLTVLLLLVPLVVMAAAYLRVVRTLWLGPHLPDATSKSESSLCGAASGVQVESVSPSRLASVSIRFRRTPSPRGPEGSLGSPQQPVQANKSSRGSPQQAPVALVDGPRLEHVCFGSGVPPAGGSRRWESDGGARWRPLRSSQAQRSLVAKRRVIRMLFVLVAEFFICWTPLFMVNLLSLYIPRQVYAALGSFGVSLVQLLAYLSSCCNPLTYCFMNAKFIQSFKLAFACTRRRPTASLRGVALVSSFRSVGVSCHHDPVPLRPSPGLSPACRNGATHSTSQGTNV